MIRVVDERRWRNTRWSAVGILALGALICAGLLDLEGEPSSEMPSPRGAIILAILALLILLSIRRHPGQ